MKRELIEQIVMEFLNSALAKMSGMILIGTIDSVKIQPDGIQFLNIETFSGNIEKNVRHWLPFGLFLNPKPGSQVIVLHISGNRSIAIALPVLGQIKPWGASGDTGIYNDKGMSIRLIATGIEFHVSDVLVATLTSAGLQIVGNISAAGLAVVAGTSGSGGISAEGSISASSIESKGDVKAGSVSLLLHVHPGVTPGPGSTGPPLP